MTKKKSTVSITQVKNNKVEILNDKKEVAKETDKKLKTESKVRHKYYTFKHRDSKDKVEIPEPDRLMTIFTKSGNVQLMGPKKDLQIIKERIKNKDNRHTFIECPAKFLTYNAALEEVTVLPADVGIIIIADTTKNPRNSRIAVPIQAMPKKLN